MKIPFIRYFKQLKTVNIFVLGLRLTQFFFTGVVVGIISYGIDVEYTIPISNQNKILTSTIFGLIVGVVSLVTHFAYCVDYAPHGLLYGLFFGLWDLFLSLNWLLAFFWLWGETKTNSYIAAGVVNTQSFFVYYSCSWSAFNPFGTNSCGKTRAVLVMQLMIAILWFMTAISGLYVFGRKKQVVVQ